MACGTAVPDPAASDRFVESLPADYVPHYEGSGVVICGGGPVTLSCLGHTCAQTISLSTTLTHSHMWCNVWDGSSDLQPHSHSHVFTIACTCCYDQIKGIHDQDLFSCSFSDSHSQRPLLLSFLALLCPSDPSVSQTDQISTFDQFSSAAHFPVCFRKIIKMPEKWLQDRWPLL